MTIPDKIDSRLVRSLLEDICGFDVQITGWRVEYAPDGWASIPKAVYSQIRDAFRLVEKLQNEIAGWDKKEGGEHVE